MIGTPVFSARIYFSYGQFQVFDSSVRLPGCAWTEGHYRQGFARRQANVCFGTLLEFGHGDLSVFLSPYRDRVDYERVIEVPFEVLSGEVVVGGPEEYPNRHRFGISKGHCRLIAAQKVTSDDRETIDLYFEELVEPLEKSRVITADDSLNPADPLMESAEVA